MEDRYDKDGTYKWFLTDSYGRLKPQQTGIYATTGTGKSLTGAGITEAFFDYGASCFYLGDGMKDEEEGAYGMFLPMEKFHLKTLELEGKTPRKVPVRLHHAFTFNLPKSEVPNYEIFTIPVKDLNRSEYSMLAETQADSDTIRILMQSAKNLNKSDGVYKLLHEVQDLVKGKKLGEGHSPSSKNFFLSVTSGTAKSMQDISNLFQPFKEDYFLVDKNCKYNLNFQELINDNKSIHYFSTKYLKDPKMKEFLILMILNKLIEAKDYAKHPVLIYIPEIRKLCPDRTYGYQKYLSEGIKEALSTMRNIGKGYSSITDSQNFSDTSQEIRDSHSITLLGKLSLTDIDKIAKIRGYNGDIRDGLANPSVQNSWLILGNESQGGIHFCFPSWGHPEPSYKFNEMFRKFYPEKMTSLSDMIDEMREKLKAEENFFKEKAVKQIEAERISKKRKELKKTENKTPKTPPKELKEEVLIKDYERAYNLRVVKKMTLKEAGDLLGVGKDTINRWTKKYKAILRKNELTDSSTEPEKSPQNG